MSAEQFRISLPNSGHLNVRFTPAQIRLGFAVVYVHGFCSVGCGEKARALEAECISRNVPFATFDFRGHGESSGSMLDLRGSGLLEDLDAVARFLREKGMSTLYLVGSSMGGWAAAWFALRNPDIVHACSLIAPGFHFLTARYEGLTPAQREKWKRDEILPIENQWIKTEIHYGLYEESPLFPKEELLKNYRTPTLIFQGMRDDIVSHARTIAFVESCAAPRVDLLLYNNGDHRLAEYKKAIAYKSCDFFSDWPRR